MHKKIKIVKMIALLAMFSMVPKFALAAPSISSTDNNFSDEQSVTINGAGFGSGGPNVLFFDNFEGGTVGQNIKTGTSSATIGQWDSFGSVAPVYSADASISGTKAFKVTSTQGVEGHTNGFITLPDTTETFISWWTFVPSSSPWSGEGESNGINWKMMWLMESKTNQSNPYNDLVVPTLLSTATTHIVSGNYTPIAYPDTEPWQSSSMVKGSWHHYWTWIKDGYSSDGNIRLWELTQTGPVLAKSIVNKTTLFAGGLRKFLSVNGYTRQM